MLIDEKNFLSFITLKVSIMAHKINNEKSTQKILLIFGVNL